MLSGGYELLTLVLGIELCPSRRAVSALNH